MPVNFANSPLTSEIAHQDIPFGLIRDEQLIPTTSAPITLKSGNVRITATSAAALTLAVPDLDGQELCIISESAFTHTITTPAPGFNNVSTYTVITLSPNLGDIVTLRSADGIWWVVNPPQSRNLNQQIQVLSGDGAINIKNGLVSITKGSAAAITIPVPVAGTDDGAELTISAETAFAHVITQSTVGFNGKGASGTLTWAAAKGNAVILHARNGQWWVDSNIGVTVA